MPQRTPIPLNSKLFLNLPETALKTAFGALENGFVNEAGGISRFPGLEVVAEFGAGDMHLFEYKGNMMAIDRATGRLYELNSNHQVVDRTATPLSGGLRPIFTAAGNIGVMAAGREILQFDGKTTKILSENAPLASHVGYIDGYLIAPEVGTNQWQNSDPNDFSVWNPLDAYLANSLPDEINGLFVTPLRQIMVPGPKSVEQFERLQTGTSPFYRRYSVGQGVQAPYTMCFADNVLWAVNQLFELARYTGQTNQGVSDDINKAIINADNWTDAWATDLFVFGQKYILLQIPNATNAYGSKGITFAFDYRLSKWCQLYGWDQGMARPTRWPGCSALSIWNKVYVGGTGKVYRFTDQSFYHGSTLARFLVRTAPFSQQGETEISEMTLNLQRGVGSYTDDPKIRIRALRDNNYPTNWISKGLGAAGERDMTLTWGGMGCAANWQFEIQVTDNCAVQLRSLEAMVDKVG